MEQAELVLLIIKLVLGGIVAFLAILLWNRTRDAAWMSLVAGAIVSYAGIVYEMLDKLGISFSREPLLWGIPVSSLIFAIVPAVFYIIAFVLMIIRNRSR